MADWGYGDWANLAGNVYGAITARDAAKDAASANLAAADRAAAAAEFKPYSITTGFGTSYFDKDKQQAGYELDPVMRAFRDQFYGGAGDFMSQIQTDPTKAAADYYQQQMGLMAPQRQAEDIALRQQQLKSGRIGLGLSPAAMGAGGTGAGYVNPEQYQRDLARAQVDAQTALQSRELAQAEIDKAISRGTGLLQTGLGIEELGLKPLTIGADIGNKQAVAGANQGQALLAGGQSAAQANLAAGLGTAGMFSNIGRSAGGYKYDPYTGKPV